MKTKLTLTLLALAAISTFPARGEEVLIDTDGDGYAETVVNLNTAAGAPVNAPAAPTQSPPICGGADDDQLRANLCGGADDDQIVGGDGADFVRQQLGYLPPMSGPGNPLVQVVMSGGNPIAGGLGNDTVVSQPIAVAGIAGAGIGGGPHLTSDTLGMTTDGGGWTLVSSPQINAGDPDFLVPVLQGLTSDTLNVVTTDPGDGGILTDAQIDRLIFDAFRFAPICGGNGNDSYRPIPAITGDAGDDELWAGGGTDEFTGDSMDNDDITDEEALRILTTGSLHGDEDNDTLWGGGATDEYMGDGMDDLDLVTTTPAGGSI